MRLENPNIGKYQVCELLDIKGQYLLSLFKNIKTKRYTIISPKTSNIVYSKNKFYRLKLNL